MKSVLLALVFLSSAAFARNIRHQVTITKGPYTVPVTNSVFNPLDTDFKSEGNAVVYMTGLNINVEFPRVPLFTLEATPDKDNYFFSKSDKGPKIRVGFEGEKLSWFFGRSSDWNVTISKEAQEHLVPPTPFAQMNDEQITEFANRVFEETQAGGLDNAKIQRNGRVITLTADVLQMGEDDDDPSKAGKAVVTFHDNEGARAIVVEAQVKN